MRILHALSSGGMYGKERMLYALANRQRSMGHDVDILVLDNQETADRLTPAAGAVDYVSDMKEFIRLIKAHSPYRDIIHTHDYKTGIMTPIVADRSSAGIVRTVHGYTNVNKYNKLAAYEWMDKRTLTLNDHTVVVADSMLRMIPNASVITNGIAPVNPDASNLLPEIVEFCDTDDFVLCCMARLSPEKNLSNLIDAVYDGKMAKLLLFGDGPLRKELEEQNKRRSLGSGTNRVYFGGFNPNSRDYLSEVDGYIQPSLTEGMPISVLEAMSMGVPLITTNVGGMGVLHSKNYNVSAPCFNSVEGMRTSIHSFIVDEKSRKERAERGKKVFDEVFSDSAMYNQYQSVYQRMLEGKGRL